jgi:hypothetical protein
MHTVTPPRRARCPGDQHRKSGSAFWVKTTVNLGKFWVHVDLIIKNFWLLLAKKRWLLNPKRGIFACAPQMKSTPNHLFNWRLYWRISKTRFAEPRRMMKSIWWPPKPFARNCERERRLQHQSEQKWTLQLLVCNCDALQSFLL